MEMDCNLKKIGQFFQVPPAYCREVVKKLLIVCSSPEKYLDISFSVLLQQLTKGFLSNI